MSSENEFVEDSEAPVEHISEDLEPGSGPTLRVHEFTESYVPPEDLPPAVNSEPTSWIKEWSKPAVVRLMVTGLVVVVVCVALLWMLGGVLIGVITPEEASELGAPTLFSGLLALAGTVVGYYFGDRK